MQSQKPQLLFRDSYLAMIRNSVGSRMFRNLYATMGGRRKDILRDGDLACAFYVSSILLIFGLIKDGHATVDGTVKDLRKSGWKKIKKPKIGSILVWEGIDFGKDGVHKHIGFYVGREQAISNSMLTGMPTKHHITFGRENGKPKRKIDLILWHKKLE